MPVYLPVIGGTQMIARPFSSLKISRFGCAALVACWLTGCGSNGSKPTASIQSSATIWFHPLPAADAWPDETPNGGSTDFLGLFQQNSQWPKALAKTQVFGMYAGWIVSASDQELAAAVVFLNAHNLGIEIEAPAMQALATCGSGVEGYVPYGQSLQTFTLAYLTRLKALGAQVPFIKVDEPYFFGNVVGDPRSCHFTVQQIATEVGQYTQLVHTIYPNTAVGDVEPVVGNAYVPDVVTALEQWHQTYQSITGAPFPFFIEDIDFSNPQWPSIVKTLEDASHREGMQSGIIYIGDETDTSDAEWSSKAIARFQLYQGQSGGNPDFVLFQSWQPHPQFCLPESGANTFTGVLDAYLKATGAEN